MMAMACVEDYQGNIMDDQEDPGRALLPVHAGLQRGLEPHWREPQ